MRLDEIISRFGNEARRKLANPAISGAPEDQLRGPFETLLTDLTVERQQHLQPLLLKPTAPRNLGLKPVGAIRVRMYRVAVNGDFPLQVAGIHGAPKWVIK